MRSELETWNHVSLCAYTQSFRNRFIEELLKELLKNRLLVVKLKDIFDMMEDALVHLEKRRRMQN